MENKRSFKIVNVTDSKGKKIEGVEGGRFISSTPSGAAGKVGTQICRAKKLSSLIITIQEITRGSKQKEKRYTYERVNEPTTVNHNGTMVVHQWKTVVKAY